MEFMSQHKGLGSSYILITPIAPSSGIHTHRVNRHMPTTGLSCLKNFIVALQEWHLNVFKGIYNRLYCTSRIGINECVSKHRTCLSPSAGLSGAHTRLKSLRNLGVGFCELLLLHGQHRTNSTLRGISVLLMYSFSFTCIMLCHLPVQKMRSSIFV